MNGPVGATVREAARAKLNLFLDVTGRRADGFHELVTVFHEVALADDLTMSRVGGAGSRLVVTGDAAAGVPCDGTNLVLRAVAALAARRGADVAVAVERVKRTPAGGGLGGGSADAAAALRAANRLLGFGAGDDELEDVAATLGSDISFLVRGGSALGRGRGERLERIPAKPIRFLLLVPAFPLATAAVYRALPRELPPPMDVAPTLRALEHGDAAALGAACRNALFPAACRVDPRAAEVMDAARAVLGPRVHLTGSGSTFFAPLGDDEAVPAADVLAKVPHLARVIETRSAG